MNLSNFRQNFAVFRALLGRDFKLFRNQFLGEVLNGATIIFFQTLMFGYVVPLLGMPIKLVTPIFLGSVTIIMISIGYALALPIVYDLKYSKQYTFHFVLPLSKPWLLAAYIISMMFRIFFLTFPLILFGKVILGQRLDFSNLNLLFFALHYLITLCFLSSLFVSLAFSSPFYSFIHNIWPRLLSPLQHFGCALFPWGAAYMILPNIALILLFNPMTSIVEGFRSAVLQTTEYLPFWGCFAWLSFCTCLNFIALLMFFKRRHDPV